MLEDVMNKEMFRDFVFWRMEEAESDEKFVKQTSQYMNSFTGKVLEFGNILGQHYYAAVLRDGQLLQKSGGLPVKEMSPRPTTQN